MEDQEDCNSCQASVVGRLEGCYDESYLAWCREIELLKSS
jgi:hypothetical protein